MRKEHKKEMLPYYTFDTSLFWLLNFFSYFFLFGRCVKAEAAAVFAALLEFGLLNTFPAAEAAVLLVCSLFLAISTHNY